MANLALNKLPIEKDNWKNPEDATDGNITDYDGHNHRGFAAANWPCSFTLDLDTEHKISIIRILLFDNLGKPNSQISDRKYKFSLSLSGDGVTYYPIYSNEHSEGGLGWYSFELITQTYARYIRLNGLHNSKNDGFHIVQFEVHDDNPRSIEGRQVIEEKINTSIPSQTALKELLDSIIIEKTQVFHNAEERVDKLNKAQAKFDESLNKIEFISKTHDYLKESQLNIERSKWWLRSSVVAFVVFLGLLIYFLLGDKSPYHIIDNASKSVATKPYTVFFLTSYYITKAILLSVILFAFSWLLKNYRAERHNYVVNKHKAMSLLSIIGVVSREDLKEFDKSGVFLQALEVVFSHQNTGFSKDDAVAPNIINTLLHHFPQHK